MAVIQENPWVKDELQVNMAYLACVASGAVNGVAAIHSEIVKQDIFNVRGGAFFIVDRAHGLWVLGGGLEGG